MLLQQGLQDSALERMNYILEGIIQLAVETSMLPIHAQQNETDAHRSLESISQLLIRIKAMVQVARTDEAE
ncbi:hypothetical protein EVAR_99619_1 [Eumeta japonica]|uniref:Uncharacterized protein n=1 Tax=Eumeta variegata TaxID=151549 RepID=A0A4C1SFG4_EUMVA|nr:hypothetical protein EVAR_99619_1 [Eumeta japonica]